MTQEDMIKRDEAMLFVATIGDPRVRAGLSFALTTVLLGRGMDQEIVPGAPFDLRFYVEAVKAMFENDRAMREIVDGEAKLEW